VVRGQANPRWTVEVVALGRQMSLLWFRPKAEGILVRRERFEKGEGMISEPYKISATYTFRAISIRAVPRTSIIA